MATNKPAAVATKASPIGPATAAMLIWPELEILIKAWYMPQTVPNKPMKGAVAPIDAKVVRPLSNGRKALVMALRMWRTM